MSSKSIPIVDNISLLLQKCADFPEVTQHIAILNHILDAHYDSEFTNSNILSIINKLR